MPPQPPDPPPTGNAPHGDATAPSDDALDAHLARLWAAGRSLAAPLQAYAAELPAGAERREIRHVIRQLQADTPPTAGHHHGEIPYDLLALLSAGSPDQGMGSRLIDYVRLSRRRAEVNRRVLVAALYPLVLLAIALALFLACTAFLTPVYESIYRDFGTELPGLTLLIIRISAVLHATSGLVVLLPLAGLVTVAWLYRHFIPPGFRESVLDWVPLLGPVLRFSGLANFTNCLSGLLDAGVPTVAALRLAGRGSRQARIQHAADHVAAQMESEATSVRLEGLPPRIPATVVHTLQTQPSPAAAAVTLRELAGAYDARAQDPLRWIGGIFEPLFVILVGSFIGLLFLGLLLPFVSLIQNLT